MNWVRRRRSTCLVATAVATTVAVLVLSACGRSATSTTAASGATTFTSKEYGFSLTYPARQLRLDVSHQTVRVCPSRNGSAVVVKGSAGKLSSYPASLLDLVFYDRRSKDDYSALGDGSLLLVSAVQATHVIRPPTLTALRRASMTLFLGEPGRPLAAMKRQGYVVGRWQSFSLQGLQGFTITSRFADTRFVRYELFDGRRAYFFDICVSQEGWRRLGPMLDGVVGSFTLVR